MSKYTGFMIKCGNTSAFFDINDTDEIPSLSFHFGTADAMEMNFEILGRIIALANWKAISIWAMAKDNDGGYRTMITDDIEISHIGTESFFELMENDVVVDFKKYDILFSNSDFKHQKTIDKW